MNALVRGRFGTYRGLVRAALSVAQLRALPAPNLADIQRLVFVCHGNICRSAFAERLAHELGIATASFGLSTSPDRPAHLPVVAAAQERGIGLSSHRSTPIDAFAPLPGDLYLVMEVRQIARLRRDSRFATAKVDLLGRYGGLPHLHDPYMLSEAFTRTSLRDIDRSVRGVIAAIHDAKPCASH